jgi:hypothetical protein
MPGHQAAAWLRPGESARAATDAPNPGREGPMTGTQTEANT